MKKRITSLHPRPAPEIKIAEQPKFRVMYLDGNSIKTVDGDDASELGHRYDGHDSYFIFERFKENGFWYVPGYDPDQHSYSAASVARQDGRYVFKTKSQALKFTNSFSGFINR